MGYKLVRWAWDYEEGPNYYHIFNANWDDTLTLDAEQTEHLDIFVGQVVGLLNKLDDGGK